MRTALLVALPALALVACTPKEEAKASAADGAAQPVSAAAADGLTLGADKLPRFRAGVWEVAKTEEGETEVTRHCVGEEANADLREMLTRETPDCQTQRAVAPGGIRIDAVCAQAGGLKTETHLAMTGSPAHYDMKLGIYLVTPDGKRDGSDVVLKARFTGQGCPAGVKPGDDIE